MGRRSRRRGRRGKSERGGKVLRLQTDEDESICHLYSVMWRLAGIVPTEKKG
jgi:hypothetical protein